MACNYYIYLQNPVLTFSLKKLLLVILRLFHCSIVNISCGWFAPIGNHFSFVWEENKKFYSGSVKSSTKRECSCRIDLLYLK